MRNVNTDSSLAVTFFFFHLKHWLLLLLIWSSAAICFATQGKTFSVIDFGAKGDGISNDAPAIQQAINACWNDGGGTVLFPANKTYLCGPIELKGKTEYLLEEGAIWKAIGDESAYFKSAFKENRGEGMLWLWAKDTEGIKFSGKGAIDGNGVAFMGAELEDSYELKPLADPRFDPRPHVLTLIGVNGVEIHGITVREGAYWTVHLIGCEDVIIDGIKLLNNIKIRNGDGIDIDHSRRVLVKNCEIESGDDCVCLKNRREWEEYGVCKDIKVENCIMRSRSCAVKIGSENMDSISNVLVENCSIWGSNRGLGIQNRDEGTVTNVIFRNIKMECLLWSDVWWGKAEPIYVTSYPRADGNHKDANWRFPKGESQGRCGMVRDILFENIDAVSENGCFVGGDSVRNIVLQNVHLKLISKGKYPQGIFDKRPCKGEGFVKGELRGLCEETLDGKQVRVQNFQVENLKQKTYDELGGVYYNYPTPTSSPSSLPLVSSSKSQVPFQSFNIPHSTLSSPRGGREGAFSTPHTFPEGYQPVYISHYGRHGSRWVTTEARYEWVMKWFEDESRLTPLGKEVKQRMERICANAKGNAGLLTEVGKHQHEGIARRMMERFPQLFSAKDVEIEAHASTSQRCIQSRDAFLEQMKSMNPKLVFHSYAREADMAYLAYSSPEEEYLIERTKVSPKVSPDRLIYSLFKTIEPNADKEKFLVEFHTIATDMQDVNIGISLYDLFTREEMEAVYQANCTRMWICNGLCEGNGGIPQLSTESLWNDIVEKADMALSQGKPIANLRFGHDSCLYRLLTLWGLYTNNQHLDEIIPMGANVQLVFYRSPQHEKVLVKVLHNEQDMQLPLEAEIGCFYDWNKMKQMVANRLNDFRQSKHISMVNTMVGTAPSIIKNASIYGKNTELLGQTLPAVLVPNGMNFWTPQTRATEKKCIAPYYYNDTKWQGFRNSHWIVGGCTQDYGSVTLMPQFRILRKDADSRATSFNHTDEISTPYYYSIALPEQHLTAEMTGTSRAAIFRFTYEQGGDAYLLVEVNSDENEAIVNVDAEKGMIEGSNPVHRIYQGWGESAGFAGHFVIQLKDKKCTSYGVEGNYAWLKFHVEENEQVLVKMASSFCDVEGAKQNLHAEIPHWDFELTKAELKSTWQKHLSVVEVESDDITLLHKFYTALYHTSFLPHAFNDVDGIFPAFAHAQTQLNRIDSGKTHYMDYSMWDTYRALHPLLNLLYPHKSGEMMQSLVSMYEDGGWMPIFPCWNSYTAAMIGDHTSAAFADSYMKGVRNFDIEKAYEGIRKNAFESPKNFEDYKNGMGRRALKSYLKYGYIPQEDSVMEAFHTREQVSRTLEYSYDDFCVAQIAQQLGKKKDYKKLIKRSENWRNVLNPLTGYVQAKNKKGKFIPFSEETDNHEAFSFQNYITEGAPCHYTWYVPHNIEGLAQAMGGTDTFEAKLDSMFSENRYWHGNEPCHQIADLFNYTQHPWKTQREVRHIMETEYKDHPGGLSGNDDAGQMSAWYVFSAMGFYPVCPGTTRYQIGSPSFRRLTLHLENGKNFTMEAPASDSNNIYIQRMELNGEPYTKTYLDHDDILQGGTMRFYMGSTPL